jgi:misacylated tRNA(Ala) deacylase
MSKKDYFPAMHTAEHILNGTMDKMFGCGRAFSSHIEKKKSKCDYHLTKRMTDKDIAAVERTVNEIIKLNIPVTEDFISRREADEKYNTGRLPSEAGDTIRIIRVGNFDSCPCIGEHVANTREIGHFTILSSDFEDSVMRLRFRIDMAE